MAEEIKTENLSASNSIDSLLVLCIYARLKKKWERHPDFADDKIKAVLLDIFDEPLSVLEAKLVSGKLEQQKAPERNEIYKEESGFDRKEVPEIEEGKLGALAAFQ